MTSRGGSEYEAQRCSGRSFLKDIRYSVVVALLTFLFAAGIACTPAGLSGNPVVWPKAARLGDTVAMSIDSNYIPELGGLVEKYDLSEDNVTVQIGQGTTVLATVVPRAVFDGLSAPASLRNAVAAGPFLTIVVFDVPTTISTSFPASTAVTLLVNGVVPAYPIAGSLELLGPGGSPTVFTNESQPEGLGPRPMLRLQARAAAPGVDGFDPAWEIGALELTLEYPSSVLSEPDVHPATEASRALAFTSTGDPEGSVRIFVSDPRGFTLPSEPGYADGTRVGEGPLLDVVFTKAAGQGFEATDFTIRDLKVFDPDGVLLTPVFSPGTDTTHWFARIARKNLPE